MKTYLCVYLSGTLHLPYCSSANCLILVKLEMAALRGRWLLNSELLNPFGWLARDSWRRLGLLC